MALFKSLLVMLASRSDVGYYLIIEEFTNVLGLLVNPHVHTNEPTVLHIRDSRIPSLNVNARQQIFVREGNIGDTANIQLKHLRHDEVNF